MVVHSEKNKQRYVEFVSYSGKAPNLCRGILVLMVNGKEYKFGPEYLKKEDDETLFTPFWASTGSAYFTNGYTESHVTEGEWAVDVDELPEELRKYASEIDQVFNANVEHGCCGGCL